MRSGTGFAAAVAIAMTGAGRAAAQEIGYHSGAVNAVLHGAVSEQVSSVSGVDRFAGVPADNLDGYARVVADWTSPQGWLLGADLETSTRRTTEALGSGEAYVYFSSGLGRIEVGRDYGPANSLAFHAPEIALGQIRGDFARYAGTQALLSAFDTAAEPKVIYLSPPSNGFRFGVSWTPSDRANIAAPCSMTAWSSARSISGRSATGCWAPAPATFTPAPRPLPSGRTSPPGARAWRRGAGP
jgi:hypothetical protein